MSGDEILGQRRDIIGGAYDQCDLCAEVYPVSQLLEVDAGSQYAEADPPLRVCASCSTRIATGELNPELLLHGEDDRRE